MTTRDEAYRQAFEAQTMAHVNELYGVALRYTRNAGDAEDLVQDSYLRAYAAWDRFIPGSNVRAWMFRILTNGFISGYRRRVKARRLHERDEDAMAAFYSESARGAAGDPEHDMIDHTMGDEVSRALDTLPPAWRLVVTLADLQGLSYREIADLMQIPVGTVMSRLFRARRHLERELEGWADRERGYRRRPANDITAVRRAA